MNKVEEAFHLIDNQILQNKEIDCSGTKKFFPMTVKYIQFSLLTIVKDLLLNYIIILFLFLVKLIKRGNFKERK